MENQLKTPNSPASQNLPVIAIDGPAASGKTTIARHLAQHYGFDHLNTGKLYRAVAHALFNAGYNESDVEQAVRFAERLTAEALENPELESAISGQRASLIARLMPVRTALVERQRSFCRKPPSGRGAVLCGRDIATFIWPQAPAKIFVVGDPEVRAERRRKELEKSAQNGEKLLLSSGETVNSSTILADIAARDARDAASTPFTLKIAPEAYVLDTTHLDVEATMASAVQFVSSRLP